MSNTAQPPSRAQSVLMARQHSAVFVKRNWGDSWRQQPYLTWTQVKSLAAPGISSANLVWHYGSIKHEDKAAFQQEAPLALDRWFVQIRHASSTGQRVLFTGRIAEDQRAISGDINNTIPTGTQPLMAYGLEKELDLTPVMAARIIEGEGYKIIKRVPPVNRRNQIGMGLAGNRSASRDENGVYNYGSASDNEGIWSNLDYLEYMLFYHAPRLVSNATPSFALSGQLNPLAFIVDEYNPYGQTPKAILDHMVDRRFGLGWCIDPIGTGTGEIIRVRVYSCIGESITAGSVIIPANNNIIPDWRLSSDSRIQRAEVVINSAQQVDYVTVAGAHHKSVFTVSLSDGLEPGWTEAEEEAYKIGDSDAPTDPERCDIERGTDKFSRVYRLFRIRKDWDWQVYDPGPAVLRKANPWLNIDGTVDESRDAAIWNYDKALQRALPLFRMPQISYAEPESISPMVFLVDPMTGLYRQADASTADYPAIASIRMTDREMALELTPRIPHILGRNHFDGEQLIPDPYCADPLAWNVPEGCSVEGGRILVSGEIADAVIPIPSDIVLEVGEKYRVAFGIGGAEGAYSVAAQVGGPGGVIGAARTQPGFYEEEIVAQNTLAFSLWLEGYFGESGYTWLYSISLTRLSSTTTNINPEYDYGTIVATVCAETDEPLLVEIMKPNAPTVGARGMTIDVPNAESWRIVPGTVYGSQNGQLIRYPDQGFPNNLIRDDSERLRQIAALSLAWFGTARSSVEIASAGLLIPPGIGTYIHSVSDARSNTPVGTVVTAITYTNSNNGGSTQIQTGYQSIDFRAMIEFPGLSNIRSVAREIRSLKGTVSDLWRQVGNLPSRWASGGAGGSRTIVIDDVYEGTVPRHGHAGPADGGRTSGLGA